MVTHKHNVAQLYRISRKDNSIREIYTERSQVQGKQENSRGLVPVRLTSSGTDAGGVPKPQPHHQRVDCLTLFVSTTFDYPVSDHRRGVIV